MTRRDWFDLAVIAIVGALVFGLADLAQWAVGHWFGIV